MSVVAAGTAVAGLAGAYMSTQGGGGGGAAAAPAIPMSQANGDTTFTFNNGAASSGTGTGLLPKVMLVVGGVAAGIVIVRLMARHKGK